MKKRDPRDRFVDKIALMPSGCWQWMAGGVGGYGLLWLKPKKPQLAHRFAYEWLVGPIPDGLTLDHLCRNRGCVNPSHLEPVTQGENTLRGQTVAARNAQKTRCIHGHPFDDANTHIAPNGSRICRTCRLERSRVRRRVHGEHDNAVRNKRRAVRRSLRYPGGRIEEKK